MTEIAGKWYVYVDWNATSPNGIWHYERHDPERNPVGKHWTLIKSCNGPNECVDFIEGETGRAIIDLVCNLNELDKNGFLQL